MKVDYIVWLKSGEIIDGTADEKVIDALNDGWAEAIAKGLLQNSLDKNIAQKIRLDWASANASRRTFLLLELFLCAICYRKFILQQPQSYALLGLGQATRFTGGYDYLLRGALNIMPDTQLWSLRDGFQLRIPR